MTDNEPGRRAFLTAAAAVAGATVTGATVAGCSSAGGPAGGPHGKDQATLATGKPAPRPSPSPTPERDLPGDPHFWIASTGPQDAVEGYASKTSVLPGEPFTLHLSSTGRSVQVLAFRVGWYRGDQARLVWRSPKVRVRRQTARSFVAATRTVIADWEPSLTVATHGWPEGAYLLRLDASNGHQRYVPLIVRSASASGKSLIVHAPETWQAYNTWGGYDLYNGANGAFSTRSYVVSFNRPYDLDGAIKFMVYERAFVVLAEKLGIPLAYTTGIDAGNDPSVLHGAVAAYSLGHDEYWTQERRDAFTRARDAGTNIGFMGANTCYRRVRMQENDREVVCYKSAAALDPMYAKDPALATHEFRLGPHPDPESTLTGVIYDGYPVDASYRILEPGHWLYAGTGVRQGDAFRHLVGVEYDRVNTAYPTPRPIEVLAHSPVVCEGRDSYSDSAYYTTSSRAGVFASGTMRWVESMMAGRGGDGDDHHITRATGDFVTRVNTNLLRGFAKGPARDHYPAPHSNLSTL